MKYKSVRKMISVCLVVLFSMTFACPVFAVSEEHDVVEVVSGSLVPVGDGQYISVDSIVDVNCSGSAGGLIVQEMPSSYQPVYEINNVETVIYSDGAYETSCDITAGLYDPNAAVPYDSQSKSESESAISGTLKLTYYLGSNNEEIKITKVSGSWSQTYTNTGIDIQDMEVEVMDGTAWGMNHEVYYPEDRVFSFNTGWDYVLLYPNIADAGTGPRAFSDCEWRITGMGTNWYAFNITLYLDIISSPYA